jgi:hypothetical protein
MSEVCPGCGVREYDPFTQSFCAICGAARSVEVYRERRADEIAERRERWMTWVSGARERDEGLESA